MLIDTHCHLNFKAFDNDLSDVVRRAQNAGVEKIIVPGTDLFSSRRAVEISRQFPGICFAAIGIHPHHAQDSNLPSFNELRHQMEKLLASGRVVAIGEIGLDYHVYQKTKYENILISDEIKQNQKELLLMQMSLGLIHNLPFIFHCRDAWKDMTQTISSFAKATDDKSNISRSDRHSFSDGGHRSPKSDLEDEGDHDLLPNNYINQHQDYVKTNYINPHRFHGVFHCFSGSTQDLQLLTTMGYYIGFDGNITYSSDYSPLVASVPLNKLLIETDSPYLSPVPYRGKRNEPASVRLVAEAVAKYHTSTPLQIAEISTNNTKKLFRI